MMRETIVALLCLTPLTVFNSYEVVQCFFNQCITIELT